jgi:3-deoxy-D-manno-octulosonate 8-phosphate phosphatase (KDO 8-P phosphatase)
MSQRTYSKPAEIELIVFDVDGVLTDGTININDDGTETKKFNVRDGFGMRLWLNAGYQIAIITGRSGESLKHRIKSLKIDPDLLIQGSKDKSAALDVILERTGIELSKVAYLADDWPDIAAMARVGLPMAVHDAEPEVIEVAGFVSGHKGGRGAARDAIAHLLKAKGLYSPV